MRPPHPHACRLASEDEHVTTEHERSGGLASHPSVESPELSSARVQPEIEEAGIEAGGG